MEQFLLAVDDVEPSKEVLTAVMTWLTKEAVPNPASLAGIADSDVDAGLGGSLVARAFAKRAVWAATEIEKTKRLKTQTASPTQAQTTAAASPMPGDQASILDVVSTEASANMMAKMLTAVQKQIDVPGLLKKAHLEKLSYGMQVEMSVWKLFDAESQAAVRESRDPFLYVDLTSRHFLPVWLPSDSIGGHNMLGGEWDVNSAMETGTLAQLGKALRAASASPR